MDEAEKARKRILDYLYPGCDWNFKDNGSEVGYHTLDSALDVLLRDIDSIRAPDLLRIQELEERVKELEAIQELVEDEK